MTDKEMLSQKNKHLRVYIFKENNQNIKYVVLRVPYPKAKT